jgi:hypothetical protein
VRYWVLFFGFRVSIASQLFSDRKKV